MTLTWRYHPRSVCARTAMATIATTNKWCIPEQERLSTVVRNTSPRMAKVSNQREIPRGDRHYMLRKSK